MKTGARLLILVLLLLAVPVVSAEVGHVKLLAVFVSDQGEVGSVADLELELKPGTGRIFIETIPLAKIDTQMSARFAKEMACKFSNINCDKYDFFYTIKSPAAIVGGPSAGAAISTLTVAMLQGLDMEDGLAITGTITSGELIGPVGKVKEKITAAQQAGLTKVIIPAVQQIETEGNVSLDLVEFGKSKGIEVVAASTLKDSVEASTGVVFDEAEGELLVDDRYSKTMAKVAGSLCKRSSKLLSDVDNFDISDITVIDEDFVKNRKKAEELYEKAKSAGKENEFYSQASYCFGANIEANKLLFDMEDLDTSGRAKKVEELKKKIDRLDTMSEDAGRDTISDLQTYMIVKERILEAQEALKQSNKTDDLAYVTERIVSAEAWSQFFGQGGQEYEIDSEALRKSCEVKLKETDERVQYLNYFFKNVLKDIQTNLLSAQKYYQDKEYELCLFKASKTEAEANVIVSLLGVEQSDVDPLLNLKLRAAEREISEQISKDIFPILAYSYYEYADNLKNETVYSSLLYSEYALSMSNIDTYFKQDKKGIGVTGFLVLKRELRSADYWYVFVFVWGLLLGYLYCYSGKSAKRAKPAKRRTKVGGYSKSVYSGRTRHVRLKFKE